MSPAEMKKKAARTSIRKPLRGDQVSEHRVTPGIVRTSRIENTGMEKFIAMHHVLGYVVMGYKFIHTDDKATCQATPGDIFFLNRGTHWVEDIPDPGKPFRQILIYYTPAQMADIIAHLSLNFSIDTCVHHTCDKCMLREYVVSPGWRSLHHLFNSIDDALSSGVWDGDRTAQSLALEALVYQIISRPEGCLRTRVLGSTDPEKELMERHLREYVFSDISQDELARRCNRSLSSFKKKFSEFYNQSPRRWVIRQRLMHARLQIISTGKSITLIAGDCLFPNTAYFIKLFRDQFGMSPIQYREKYGVFRPGPAKRARRDEADQNKA